VGRYITPQRIEFVYDIPWLEGEIRDSKTFMKSLGGKAPPKSILLLQETVVEEGETIWTILMNELNKALEKVINKNKEKGFEFEVGREKRQVQGLPHNRYILPRGKEEFSNGSREDLT
jgi:hypothetical protein